jgi:hypothetical protein
VEAVDLVRQYLRAQNLEHIGRAGEAIELYERAVEAGFDSTGPYDRLIALYSDGARHRDVVRVATSALANVRTHEEKRAWYRRIHDEAAAAAARVPPAAPKSAP